MPNLYAINLQRLNDSRPKIVSNKKSNKLSGEWNKIALVFLLISHTLQIAYLCQGSGDEYFLNLEIDIQRVSADSLAVMRFVWEEEFDAGGF